MEKETRKKILFFTVSMDGGGTERVINHLLGNLDRRRFYPELVILKNEIQYDLPDDIKVISLNKKKSLDIFRLIFQLIRILKRNKPDIAVSFLDYPNLMLITAAKLSGYKGKVVISERSNPKLCSYRDRKKHFIWQFLKKVFYPKSDFIITVSKGVEKYCKDKFGLAENKIRTIYNGVDFDLINKLKDQRVNDLLFENNIPTILAVGRLSFEKDYPTLFKAFKKVLKAKKARLLLLGSGEEQNKLSVLADSLNISSYVHFMGFQSNPFAFMAHADILVLSSRWEGFPNVLHEAMACRSAVVATDCEYGPNEIIENGKTGLLVPTNDCDAIRIAILKLLNDSQKRMSIAQQGYESVKRFTVSNMTKEYERIFNEI